MPSVELNGNRIKDWPTFYRCAAQTFNAPELGELTRAEDFGQWLALFASEEDGSVPRFSVGPDDELRIEVEDTERFAERAPEVLNRLVWGLGWLNRRFKTSGQRPWLVTQFM